MQHETVNTGFVFLVLHYHDKAKGTSRFDNVVHKSNNPYTSFLRVREEEPDTTDVTLVNWTFISEENYNKLKKESNGLRKHISNGSTNGGGL